MSAEEYPWQTPTGTPRRGAFIVVEGLDRAGKTTQVKKLCDALYSKGHNIKTMRFPDRTTPIGTLISSYLTSTSTLSDHAIHLLFSANRWEAAPAILAAVAAGYTLIVDRYVYSGMIYSAAKLNPALSLDWAHFPDIGLPRPDLVVFLDLEEEVAKARGGWGEERYEKVEMQREVRRLFLEVAKTEDVMVKIDAGRSIYEVAEDVLSTTLVALDGISSPDLQVYQR